MVPVYFAIIELQFTKLLLNKNALNKLTLLFYML